MAKKKVKKIKRKLTKKSKRVAVKKKITRKPRKLHKDNFSDVIFDSRVGKTDALFVSLPDTDPEIEQAINELDALEAPQKIQENPQIEKENLFLPAEIDKPKKSFWQKLFFFKK